LIHRDYGPAIEYSYGANCWYLDGIQYLEKEYWKVLNIKKKRKILDEI